MANNKIVIEFRNIHQLWSFAQRIKALNIEIFTAEKILICDCSEEDLTLLQDYAGTVVKTFDSRMQQTA
jgi:hypothetical protein